MSAGAPAPSTFGEPPKNPPSYLVSVHRRLLRHTPPSSFSPVTDNLTLQPLPPYFFSEHAVSPSHFWSGQNAGGIGNDRRRRHGGGGGELPMSSEERDRDGGGDQFSRFHKA
ncbi:uncharacterized protein LOC118489181 [Helianthus annuus]|uniref:uncharacterized protein LOC118489181 n=1 Tax=Helianthus annuus TaxID=4232 RepID=UPI001652F21E|nr:uncharacterized protein LOC118489181 [Helianthus annuus]